MSEKPSENAGQEASLGLSVGDFALAITAFKELLDGAGALLFLGRENSVRVVGDVQKFADLLRVKLPDLGEGKAESSLDEIRQYIQLLLTFDDPSRVAEALTENNFDNFVDEEADTEKDSATRKLRLEHYRKKAELSRVLIHRSLKARSERLAATIGPVLEDVDIEVVTRKLSQLDSRVVKTPFLRLGIRYSKPSETPPWYYQYAKRSSDNLQFEIECDTADIDLLIDRLVKAKELLSEAIPSDDLEDSASKEKAEAAR